MVGRDSARLKGAVEVVRRQTGNNSVSEGLVDLSLNTSIRNFADSITGPVHVLVNNASTTPRQRIESSEGMP